MFNKELLSKKLTYRYRVAGEDKVRSVAMAHLADNASEDNIAKFTDALETLIVGSKDSVLVTDTNILVKA